MKVEIDWENIRREAVEQYEGFVALYAETWGVESKMALNLVYKELVKAGLEVNKPDFPN